MTMQVDRGMGKCPKCREPTPYTVVYLGQFPNHPMGRERFRTDWHCHCGTPIELKLWFQCHHVGETLEFSLEELKRVEIVLIDGTKTYTLHCPECDKEFKRIYGVKK